MTRYRPRLQEACIENYKTIQNMARFYVYDLTRECGFISTVWDCPANGLYESFDFKIYFEDKTRKAYLIKIHDELAGFVLLNQAGTSLKTQWNMGEFFVLAKFQTKGIGRLVAHQVWQQHPGHWEVSVIPENKAALSFWRQIIGDYTLNNHTEIIKQVNYDKDQPNRYVLSFDTEGNKKQADQASHIRSASMNDIEQMTKLSYLKRKAYEKNEPQFWRHADNAEKAQHDWFTTLLSNEEYLLFVAERQNSVHGFIIGHIIKAPDVYAPTGLTLLIDDFCVKHNTEWRSIGMKLIDEVKTHAQEKNVSQLVVVCGKHDKCKLSFLQDNGLRVVSEWLYAELPD